MTPPRRGFGHCYYKPQPNPWTKDQASLHSNTIPTLTHTLAQVFYMKMHAHKADAGVHTPLAVHWPPSISSSSLIIQLVVLL